MSKEFRYTDDEYSVAYEKIESYDLMNKLNPEIRECQEEFRSDTSEFASEDYENPNISLDKRKEQSKKAHEKLLRKMVYMVASTITVVSLAQTIDLSEDSPKQENVEEVSDVTTNVIVFSGEGVLTVEEVKEEFEKHDISQAFSVIVEDGYTEIESKAFQGYSELVSVEIPDSVTTIGEEAFAYCTSLEIEKLETANRVMGALAFREVTIQEVNISETFEPYPNLGLAPFEEANVESVSFEKGITKIPGYALVGCIDVTNIDIPETVTEIGEYAFHGCSGLESITIPDSVTTIGREAFAYCTSLKIEKLETANRVMGALAFREVTIQEVNISETFEAYPNLGLAPFEGANVEKVSFEEGITKIPGYALVGCIDVTNINIPETVTEIGEYAFHGCSGLESITIPDSVTTIGREAFAYCTSLKIEKLETANRVMGALAFREVTIQEVNISETFEAYPNLGLAPFEGANVEKVSFEEGITKIPGYALVGCIDVTNINIPETVTEIDAYAFFGCSGLESITIPSSVIRIDDSGLAGCDNLTLYVTAGSYAEAYALEKGISYSTR